MVKFTAGYECSEEDAIQFAMAKGWTPKVIINNPDFGIIDNEPEYLEVDNPIGYFDFITAEFKKMASDWLFGPVRKQLENKAIADVVALNNANAELIEQRMAGIESNLVVEFN